ncbi:MAG: ribosome maturation factor RimM [Thermodesulfobacteriota bacterium]|nr:ribosome maturation factor RimM [Thermodesulfobacteriota bacterium]
MERPGDKTGGLVLLGKITKPHGIRGEVKVYPYSGEPENLLRYSRFLIAADGEADPVPYRIERARVQKNSVLLQLANCSTRNDAEVLVDCRLYVHEDELPEPDQEEFYLRDLEGKQMVTEQGQVIGRVTGILTGAAQNLARVKDGTQEYLIPLIPEFLVAIDENEVRVSLPPGILEINT